MSAPPTMGVAGGRVAGAGVEAVLARLYVEPEFRARFLAAPEATLASCGLSPEECRALAAIDRVGLALAADSFAIKRAEKAERPARRGWIARLLRRRGRGG